MVHTTSTNGKRKADATELFELSTSTVIHDLNNLLTTVISHATLALAKTGDKDNARPHIERTMQAAKYAAALSRQLNFYAKGSHNQSDGTDLNSLISEVIDLLQPVFLSNLTVKLDFTPDLPPIPSPKLHVQQILMNLLINAAEAIPEGSGQIIIQTGLQEVTTSSGLVGHHHRFAPQPGEYLFLRITDTGMGMSEHVLAGLLLPYFTTKPRGRGLGLMSVVKTLSEWGGGLTITSQVNHGSTFTVYFPLTSG